MNQAPKVGDRVTTIDGTGTISYIHKGRRFNVKLDQPPADMLAAGCDTLDCSLGEFTPLDAEKS